MKKIIACFAGGGGNPLNYLCAVLLALALAPSASAAPQYKAALTVQGYSGSSTLENFPVLVRLSPQTVEGFSYSACASGGADISFTAADGETVLPHEIDTWNPNGESLVWVKLPSLSGTDTVFNFRWNDADPPSVTASDVWSGANFKSVWHMKFDSNNKTADAVANYEGSIVNKNAYCGERDAIIGAGYYCEDNKTVHNVKTTATDGFKPANGAATYSGWVRQVGGTCAKGYPDSANYPQIYWSSTWGNCGAIWNSKGGGQGTGDGGLELCLEGKANVINQMYVRDNTAASLKTLTIPNIFDKQWHYLVVAYDGTNRRFYLDGVLQENFNLAAKINNPKASPVRMGSRDDSNTDCVWTGDLDEMRFRAAASSADWVAAEYANVTDAAFIAYGAAQAGDGTVWVKGSPENYGSPTPAYGFQTGYAAGGAVSFSMPATAVAGEGTVTNYLAGWRFESVDQTTQARTTSASSDDQGASLDSYSGTYASYSEFTWLWDVRDTLGVGGITIAANGGTYLDLAVDVTGLGYAAGGSATLTVAYGLASDDLDATVSTTVNVRGAATVRVNRLQPNTPYYFQATLDDGNGTVQSAVVALSTSALTTGFRRIEYVEGTGTQWIDTGYLPTPSTRTVADFQFTTVEKTKRAFGVGVGNLYYDTFINNTGSGQWGYSRADSSSEKAVSGNVAVDTERHLIDFNYDNGDGGRALAIYSTNGTVTASQTVLEGSATRNATYPLAIGATRAKETASSTDKDTVAGKISKHRIYSVNIYEGDALEFALAPIRNDSGAVMFYDSVAKKFFASAGTMQTDLAYTDGGPSVETGQAVQNGTRVITLSFLGAPMERPLYLAYGPSFAGDDPADWATRQFVANIPAGETSATVSFPATWGEDSAFVARCYFDDGTTFPLWSDPIVWQDDSALVMSGGAVDGTGGDTLVVSGTLESFPGDECTLTVYMGADADHFDVAWTDLAGSVRSDIGAFSLTLYEGDTTSERYITPGTNLYVAVEATAGTKTVRSAAIPVTTKGAPVFETASVSGVSHNRITVSGTLVDLGAGNSATVTLYVGETNDENALVAVEAPVVRTATGDFTIAHNFAACGKTYYVQLRAVATTTGGTPIETRTAVLPATTQDNATYTWQAVDGDWNGDWEDSAHWKTDKTPNLGYPQTAQCTASFANCTTNNPVVVTVNGKYQVSYLKYYGAEASDVTLAGNGAADSHLTAGGVAHNANNNKSNLKAGTSITFKDLTLVRNGDWDLIRDVSTSNLTYRFEGVTTTGSGRFCVAVPAARIEFIDSSVTGRSNVMNFGGGGTVVVVDNSTLDNSGQSINFQADVPAASRGPMELTIRGTNTVITCKEFFIYNHASGNGVTINFEVPKGGFVSPPINVTGSAFGNNSSADSTAKFAFAVAEDSPALTRDGVIENNVLVQTANGFGTSRMADPLGTVPEYEGEAQGAFKYGVDSAPLEEDADVATARQILLDLQGHSSAVRGTMFLVW